LTSALDGGEWSASHPGGFTPRERTLGAHWIGGWVGLRAGLDAVVPGLDPLVIQSVAQCYTTELSRLLTMDGRRVEEGGVL
jgi:hypothetical protein